MNGFYKWALGVSILVISSLSGIFWNSLAQNVEEVEKELKGVKEIQIATGATKLVERLDGLEAVVREIQDEQIRAEGRDEAILTGIKAVAENLAYHMENGE